MVRPLGVYATLLLGLAACVGRRWRRAAWLVGGLLGASLAASVPAQGASASICEAGELGHLRNPVVTVVDGPGDPAPEQARWAELAFAYLEGPNEITFGEGTFAFEKVQ